MYRLRSRDGLAMFLMSKRSKYSKLGNASNQVKRCCGSFHDSRNVSVWHVISSRISMPHLRADRQTKIWEAACGKNPMAFDDKWDEECRCLSDINLRGAGDFLRHRLASRAEGLLQTGTWRYEEHGLCNRRCLGDLLLGGSAVLLP